MEIGSVVIILVQDKCFITEAQGGTWFDKRFDLTHGPEPVERGGYLQIKSVLPIQTQILPRVNVEALYITPLRRL